MEVIPQTVLHVPRILGRKTPLPLADQERSATYRPLDLMVDAWHYGDDRVFLHEDWSRTAILFDRRTNRVVWTYQDPAELELENATHMSPLLSGDAIVLGIRAWYQKRENGWIQRFTALDPDSGTLRWEKTWTFPANPRGSSRSHGIETLRDGSRILAWLDTGEAVGIDVQTGEVTGLGRDESFHSRRADTDSMSYVGTIGNSTVGIERLHKRPISPLPPFAALDAKTGKRRFEVDPEARIGYDIPNVHVGGGYYVFVLCGKDHPWRPPEQFFYENWKADSGGKLLDQLIVVRAHTGEIVSRITVPSCLQKNAAFDGTKMTMFGMETGMSFRIIEFDLPSGTFSRSRPVPVGQLLVPYGDLLLTSGEPLGVWTVDREGGAGATWWIHQGCYSSHVDLRGESFVIGGCGRGVYLLELSKDQPKKPKRITL